MPPDRLLLAQRRTHHRTLLVLALAVTAYRYRKPLLDRLRAFAHATSRAAHAANLISLVLAQTSADVQQYLQPALRRRGGSQPPAPVPRSLRRLLRLAATPDGLAVLQNVAGGIAQGVTREFQNARDIALPEYRHEGMGAPSQENTLHALMEALAAPAGQAVVKNTVSTAIREAVSTLVESQERGRECPPWPEVLVEGLVSEKGRRLVVDVATSVTRTVVPIVMKRDGAGEHERARSENRLVHSVSALSPMASPMRRRRSSSMSTPQVKLQASLAGRPTALAPGESPVSKQLILSMMQAQGNSGIIERLALLAIRDKALVREVLRTVVSEAVRTYLTTQASIRTAARSTADELASTSSGNSESKPLPGGSASNSGRTTNGGSTDQLSGRGRSSSSPPVGEPQKSLWKSLIDSAVVDLKRTLLSRAAEAENTGWLIF